MMKLLEIPVDAHIGGVNMTIALAFTDLEVLRTERERVAPDVVLLRRAGNTRSNSLLRRPLARSRPDRRCRAGFPSTR
jgi:hypothetical protein